jgi:hypothetical protein
MSANGRQEKYAISYSRKCLGLEATQDSRLAFFTLGSGLAAGPEEQKIQGHGHGTEAVGCEVADVRSIFDGRTTDSLRTSYGRTTYGLYGREHTSKQCIYWARGELNHVSFESRTKSSRKKDIKEALVAIALIIKFLIWMEKPNGYKRFSTS